jgi:hypothetical protein
LCAVRSCANFTARLRDEGSLVRQQSAEAEAELREVERKAEVHDFRNLKTPPLGRVAFPETPAFA